jgi:ferredoxin
VVERFVDIEKARSSILRGRTNSMKKNITKIIHNREGCIGCGSCAALCPKFWEMNMNDMKSDLKNAKINKRGEFELEIENINKEDLECNKAATDACPVNVINIIHKK